LLKSVVVACALLVGLCGPGYAGGLIIGDSLGMGVAMVSGLPRLARLSVPIRGTRAISQINQVPAGSTAFMSLGTNDAVGSIKGLDKHIDNIAHAARNRGVALVWIGPPCVKKDWNTRSRQLDQILQSRLSGTSVRYVSMHDSAFCNGGFHAGDGVHLNGKGYALMWNRARAAVGFASVKPGPEQSLTNKAGLTDKSRSGGPT
jgi:hypothetical protein